MLTASQVAASMDGNLACVKALLDAGANATATCGMGKTALAYCADDDRKQAIRDAMPEENKAVSSNPKVAPESEQVQKGDAKACCVLM